MATIHGRLGAVALAATTNTTVYQVPTSRKSTVTLSLCNRGSTDVTVRIALIDGSLGSLANEDYIAYDLTLAGNGVIERGGLTMAADCTLMAYASAAQVSAVAWGVEQDV